MATTKTSEPVDMKLEVVVIGVSDVDRAKTFYEKLGWRLDADFANGDFRVVQLTPHNSRCSIIFGKGVTSPKPGAVKSLTLAVDDIEAARTELEGKGIEFMGETFDTGVCHMAFFSDPDGNDLMLHHRYAPRT